MTSRSSRSNGTSRSAGISSSIHESPMGFRSMSQSARSTQLSSEQSSAGIIINPNPTEPYHLWGIFLVIVLFYLISAFIIITFSAPELSSIKKLSLSGVGKRKHHEFLKKATRSDSEESLMTGPLLKKTNVDPLLEKEAKNESKVEQQEQLKGTSSYTQMSTAGEKKKIDSNTNATEINEEM